MVFTSCEQVERLLLVYDVVITLIILVPNHVLRSQISYAFKSCINSTLFEKCKIALPPQLL